MAEKSVLRRGLRLIVEIVRWHPLPFAVSVFGAATFAAATVVATIVLGRITDRVVLPTFETGEIPDGSLGSAVLAIAAVTIIRTVGVICRRYFAAMTSEYAQVSIRHRLVDRYLTLPLSWYQRVPAGQLLAHADNDTEIASDVMHPLPFSLGVVFLALFSSVSLFVVDPLIAGVAMLIFPALTLLNRLYSQRVEGPAARVQAGVGEASAIAHESFDGALVVKTLGRAEAESRRFATAARELQARRQQVGYLRSAFEAALDALPNLGIVVVVIVGAYRVEAGAMTLGDLVQVSALFTVLALPMRVFGYFLETIPPSVVARERLNLVFDEDLPPVMVGGASVVSKPSVTAEGVAFTYEKTPVLSGIDFTIAPGQVVALVGSTGAGKSTLCNLIAGLVAPSSGEIRIGDVLVGELDPLRRTEAIALVFQESFLFADSVRANVDLSGGIEDAALAGALATAQVDRFLDDLPQGIETVLGERGVTLSGGQRQRVALARALVRRPRLLLLDDATSAVDAVVEQEILTGLRRDLEATTIIVAQRVSTIELADRVLYLSGGRIAAAGSHTELLAHPGYEALVRAYEDVV